jgi:hypothetical protein
VKIGATKIDIGANKSAEAAEEEDEAVDEENEKTEIDLIDAFRLQLVPELKKKEFVGIFKEYAKELKDKLTEEKYKNFQLKATPYIKNLIETFDSKERRFYMSENFAGMTIMLEFEKDDGPIHAFYYADGLKSEKF